MTSTLDPRGRVGAARRRVALAVSIVAALTLLCCGGTVSAFFLGGLGDEANTLATAAFDCGGRPVKPTTKLPNLRNLSPRQMANALTIIQTGDDLKVPVRGWVIAIATALVESNLRMYANSGVPSSLALPHDAVGHDHDSVGLFQQRPSPPEGQGGWGAVAELMDTPTSARKFYGKLLTIPDWERLPLTKAAQKVQVSGYPDAYASREPLASEIVNLLTEGSARVAIGAGTDGGCAQAGQISSTGWTVPVTATVGSGFRTADRPTHQGVDLIVGRGTAINSAAAGVVTVVKCDEDFSGGFSCDKDGYPGKGGCGWMVEVLHADKVMTRYCHMLVRPMVHPGQAVNANQQLGIVGTSGNSSGPHLHFEVHLNNNRYSSGAIDPVKFMRDRGAPLGPVTP